MSWLAGAFRRRRKLLSGGTVSLAAATIAGFALVNPGYPTAEVQLNDGGVWVTNGSELLVGRLNRQIDELDAALTSDDTDVDVLQEESTVFAVQPDSGILRRVDVSYVSLDTDVRVPAAAVVGLGGGTVTVLDPVRGELWTRAADQVGALDIDAQAPDLSLGPGAVVAVGPTGVVAGVSVESDELTVVDPATGSRTVALGRDLERASVTVVGDQAVVLDPERSELIMADGSAQPLGDAPGAVLQQPGRAADGVLVATDAALLDIPLAGGEPTTLGPGSGGPIAPVRVAGCAHAAWAATPTYLQACAGKDNFGIKIPGAEPGAALRFRVNRSVVVLNDLQTGNVWLLDAEMTVADNWDDVRPPDPQDRTDEQSDELEETETLARNEQNQPPVATDDEFGARPALPTLLPVLDNDTDPDGDLLVISALQQPDPSRGSVAVVDDGRRLQFTSEPGAAGTVVFRYAVDDGRQGTDHAEVRVEIRPWQLNEPPVQVRDSATVVEQGGTVSHDVLTDWIDPDGDELSLAGAAPQSATDTVRFTARGIVTFIDSGTEPGLKDVVLEVTDGAVTGAGALAVEVRPPGQLPPTARADHITTFVGETATVSPLSNDTDPNGDPLRLSAVDTPTTVEVVPDYIGGTFTVTPTTVGTHYLVYTVVDGPNSTQGLVRVDVLAEGENTAPVAVRDLAFVPPAGSTTIDVLANDVDVDGDVLVVTGVAVTTGAGLSVSIRDHRFLTIAAPGLLPGPVAIRYTVSDGTVSVQGGVIVQTTKPNPENQPPVTQPDTATVRAGDVLTLDVLTNDTDPDGDVLHLVPELAEPASGGTITVVGDRLHVQAPSQPGTVRAVYAVADSAGQTASSLVTIYVRAADGQNSPPTPKALTARALTSSTTRVDIPLSGIDPDGDSVRLVGVGSAPQKGRVVEVGTDQLVYEAYTETGTDSFSYVVEDRFGARGSATLRVGIAERTAGNQPPTAQDDAATTRPGRTVTVDVLANDSDPDGDSIRFVDDPFGDTDADVRRSGGRIRIVAPEQGEITVAYTITDGRGGQATGYLTVTADDDAPLQPPVAVDDVLSTDVLVPGEYVPVDVLANDSDPDGSAEDLDVTVDVADEVARVDDEGRVLVRGATAPQTVAYTVTDVDGLSATAVVLVPSAANLPPRLRPEASPVTVDAEGGTWSLSDLVVDPEGADVRLTGAVLDATKDDSTELAEDETTLRFVPQTNYSGPASLTFEVSDGAADDPDARTAVLTLEIVVDAGDSVNTAPVFPGASLAPAIGEDALRLDLAGLVEDPDEDDEHTFEPPDTLPAGFDVTLDGTVLVVAVADGTEAGRVGRLDLTVDDGTNPPQPAPVDLTVVSSSRPLTRAVQDTAQADQGEPVTVDVVANDANPFPDTPLTVTAGRVVAGTAEVSVDGGEVTVTPGGSFVGTVTVEYRVRDKSEDAEREVTGLLQVTVRGVPGQPVAPTVLEVRDSTVVLSWPSPVANGAPILDYVVEGDGVSETCPTTTCTITGLTNGSTYRFTVTARNDVGESPASPPSGPARPDNQPDPPAAPVLTFGDGRLDVAWTAPRNTGSAITHYEVELSPGGGAVQVSGTSHTFTGLTNGQSYQVRVRAFNSAPDPSEWSPYSAPEIPAGVPARPDAPTAAVAGGPIGGQVQVDWAAPDPNGDPLDTYTLQVRRNGAVVDTRTFDGGTTSALLPADNKNQYSFVVSATNKAGTSLESAPSSAVDIYGKPATITAVSAAPGNQSATLTFTAPDDSGQAIQRYEVQWNGGSATIGGPGQSVGGLTNGGDYAFQVRACNTYCADWSAGSNTVRPFGPPHEPSQVNVQESWKNVTFSWSTAPENGRPIARYEFSIDGGGWQNAGLGTGPVTVGNGYFQSHSIQVRAVDTEGLAGPARGATGNTSRPSVAVYRGSSAVGVGNCVHPSCGYIVVEGWGFQPGTYRITYGDNSGGAGDLNAVANNIGIGGDGHGVRDRPKYYGYPNRQVWATVDGVTSPQYTWPN